MAILVTGGAGYIGSHTCVELLNSGYAPLSNEVRSYFNEDSDDTVVATGDGAETEPVIPTTGHVVENDTPTVEQETAATSPTAPPDSAAEPKKGSDTATTRKRTQSPAEGKTEAEKLYLRILLVTDYICGMTDSYAMRLYQEMRGMFLSGTE